ncbi:MAG: aldo/keto reductase [Planctomycetes bacterium]|nr:aldo/keto reductase [Planctomycetota bacterium]
MLYRPLGRSGVDVSAISLGTVELGQEYGIPAPGAAARPDEEGAARMVLAAIDRGVNLIDTSPAYGDSEERVGRILGSRRMKVLLATKARIEPDRRGAAIRGTLRASVERSLAALRTDYLDIVQVQNATSETLALDEPIQEIRALRDEGKTRFLGASVYGPEAAEVAMGLGVFDVLQIAYSVLDQRPADRVLPAAAGRGIGILVRSVLLKGALTARGEHLPAPLEPVRDRSRAFRRLVAERFGPGREARIAISFALARREVSSVLVGVSSVDEMEEDLASLDDAELPSDFLESARGLRIDDPRLVDPRLWPSV